MFLTIQKFFGLSGLDTLAGINRRKMKLYIVESVGVRLLERFSRMKTMNSSVKPVYTICTGRGECLIIQVDSREQKYDHVTNHFDEVGVKWVKSKCVVGDYVNLENPMVVIDRKKDLQEVAGNLTQQHERFKWELELAKELGYKLIILVEEPGMKTLTDVCKWYNWRRKRNPKAITGKTLYKIMLTVSEKYGVTWEFCTKETCGKRILELLGGEP